MSFDAERLYELLPAIYRVRDAEQGEPLRALVAVIAEQIGVLEENLEQLYDDTFIETCADWVVPYIGDLIGYRTLHGVAPEVSSPRAEVAHTIGFRRRKGTASMLEQLARDVTGWNARVVEFFQLLATTQYMNHLRPKNRYGPDLRRWRDLEHLDGPFDSLAHSVEVRRIASGGGRYNIPNIGIFLWRLDAYPLTDSPAAQLDTRRYLFSPLGNNTPLFTLPEIEDEITHLAEPINVPMPIGRRTLDADLQTYYGEGKSVLLEVDGAPVPPGDIVACDLSDAGGGAWAHESEDKIGLDPELGRLAFPTSHTPPSEVKVTFHYGFSARIGGGEYERGASFAAALQPVQEVLAPASIQPALSALTGGGAVQIGDSGRYEETLSIEVDAGKHLELRSANERRPTVVLGGEFQIAGGNDAEVTLNGLLIAGGKLRVPADASLRRLRLRHCTLVPGLSLTIDGAAAQAGEPSLIVEPANVTVEIENCIMGGIRVARGSTVEIRDSFIDANEPTNVAFAAVDGESTGGTLTVEETTIIGKVHARLFDLASNTIFLAELAAGDAWPASVRAERRQEGCVRFSYVPWASLVPRRYQCHPADEDEADRIRPQFTTLRYGEPAYGQLTLRCPDVIRRGADDEAEMGAFHMIYQPQRETNLRIRLEEYLRIGLEAGVFYAT